MNGAANQSAMTGAAGHSACGFIVSTITRAIAAVSGLAAICRTNTRARGRPARPALAAAVSHSSKRRCVTPRRITVTPMACSMSAACVARNATCRTARAVAVLNSSPAPARKARQLSRGAGPPSVANTHITRGSMIGARIMAVHATELPGSNDQLSSNAATVTGAMTLRRRLSRIFHRAISGSRLRCTPVRAGTNGKSHQRICQSPLTHRC